MPGTDTITEPRSPSYTTPGTHPIVIRETMIGTDASGHPSVTGHSPSAKGIQPREYGLGPLDRTSPDPYLVLVGWSSEPDPDRSLRPGNRMGLYEFLDTVLP
jgi:hypothetical protein